jgi:signal peptidase I
VKAGHEDSKPIGRHVVRYSLLAVLIALVGAAVFAVVSGRYQVRPVLSGSMRPGLPVGGVVITERVPISSLHVRDVVVLHRPDQPGELVVHRIISLKPGPSGPVVRTQGDANSEPDPWTVTLRGDTAYRAVYSLPLVGYAAVWAHSATGRRFLLLIGLVMVLGAALGGVLVRRKRATSNGEALEPLVVEMAGETAGDADANLPGGTDTGLVVSGDRVSA